MRVGRVEEKILSDEAPVPKMLRFDQVVGFVRIGHRPRGVERKQAEYQQRLGPARNESTCATRGLGGFGESLRHAFLDGRSSKQDAGDRAVCAPQSHVRSVRADPRATSITILATIRRPGSTLPVDTSLGQESSGISRAFAAGCPLRRPSLAPYIPPSGSNVPPFVRQEGLIVSAESPGKSLRAAIESSTILIPGAFNALTARLIERLGFRAMYLSGAAFSAGALSLPGHRAVHAH